VVFRKFEEKAATTDVKFGSVPAAVYVLITENAPVIFRIDLAQAVFVWSEEKWRQGRRDLANKFGFLQICLQPADEDVAGVEGGSDDGGEPGVDLR